MLKRTCHYYNTTGKCHFGKHCKFLHSIETTEEKENPQYSKNEAVNSLKDQPLAEGLSSSFSLAFCTDTAEHNESLNTERKPSHFGKEEGRICRSYASTHFCRYGNRCKFQHVQTGRKKEEIQQKEIDVKVVAELENEQQKDSLKNVSIAKSATGPKVCRFYKRGFCHFGERCKFLHLSSSLSKKASDEPKEGLVSGGVASAIDNHSNVEAWTQVLRAPKVVNVYRREDVDAAKLQELRETEIKQLKRRFPADKLTIISETDEKATFIFSFIPSDPDWPFDVRSFDIEVSFSEKYPLKLFSICVPLDQDLPATVQRYIQGSLQEWIVKKEEENAKKDIIELLFRPFLRWMDRNMENIVTEGLKQLRRDLTAKAAGLQFISANELQKDQDVKASANSDYQEDSPDLEAEKDSRRPVAYRKFDQGEDEVYTGPDPDFHPENIGSSSSDDDDDGSDDSGDKDAAVDDEEKLHQRPHMDPDTERRGTEMSFRNMQIWTCTTVMMEKLRLIVQCERCKNTTDFNTPPNRVNSVSCSKCNNTQLVLFRPVLAHAYGSTFGYLDLEGCLAFDVILQDCHFSMGCSKCSRDILVKSFVAGRIMEIRCRGCHTTMKFSLDSVKLTTLTSEGVDSAKFSGKVYTVKVRKNRVPKDPAIQEGKPLPENGACKHYKKSYRWLRFPCCGKTYPCDICHDSKEDHEMKFANRMICGFCCKEQPFAAEKPCSGCSSGLTKVRTSHWEGGQGCRDKITMSRSDERKYSNLHKTVSNKAKAQQEKNKGKKNTKLRHT